MENLKLQNMKKQLLTISLGLIGISLSAQTLVKDIRPGGVGSNLASIKNINGTLFMIANDGTNGNELYTSDGTTTGTNLVTNIAPGSSNSFMYDFTESNGKLFFNGAAAFNQNSELWTSDGTAAGTFMVKDINVGTGSSNPGNMCNLNGILFFSATNGVNGSELWKSEGTDASTLMVKDISVGSGNSNPRNLTVMNNELYFRAASNGLWKSDGTDAGTTLIMASVISDELINVNGTLFFQGTDGELWKSDGTTAGTMLVKDINVGTSASGPTYLTNVNGTLYFAATEGGSGTSGRELWKSDGTTAGTVLVKDAYPGGNNSDPNNLFAVNNTLYYSATDGTNGRELWKSDGTIAGTVMVKDINPNAANSISPTPPSSYYFTNINDTLFFSATDGVNGQELWKSDGTSAGTVMVSNTNTNTGDFKPLWFAKLNNTIYFSAEGVTGDLELWKYGTSGAIGLHSISKNANYTIFPNPSAGKFTINTPNTLSKIEVYNVIGEKILEQENSNEIDLSSSPKGMYLVKIYEGLNTVTKRIVIQ